MAEDSQIIIAPAADASFAPFALKIDDNLYYVGLDRAPGSPAIKLSRHQILLVLKTLIDLIHSDWFIA